VAKSNLLTPTKAFLILAEDGEVSGHSSTVRPSCSLIIKARFFVPGSSEEGDPTPTVEDESMEDPLTMGPPSRDPQMAAGADEEASPAVRLRAHYELMATHVPQELELREPGSGVWTRQHVSRGIRYGPFLGKWTPEPIDPRYAWEVSLWL
jgi:hypothetical protein